MTSAAPAREAERVVALRALCLALRAPSESLLAEVGLLAAAVEEGGGPLAPAAGALREASELPCSTIAAAQHRLFGGDVPVPPYEGSYEADPFRQARQLADVAGFYRAFGAESRGPARERPDHAGAELEFLAFLGVRKAEALAASRLDDAGACADVERSFVEEHAGRWLPRFFGLLGEAAADPFHRAVAALGSAVVGDLVAALGVTPRPVPARAGRTPVEADELTCAAGDERVLPGLA